MIRLVFGPLRLLSGTNICLYIASITFLMPKTLLIGNALKNLGIDCFIFVVCSHGDSQNQKK